MNRRRTLVLGALALALAAATFTAGADEGDGRFSRSGSRRIGPGEAMVFRSSPSAYRVEYRREPAGGTPSTEVLAVERPFRSQVVAEQAYVRRSDFGRLSNEAHAGGDAVLVVPPALAAGDLRPDVALEAAVATGIVERGDRREIAGRVCQVYRAGAPLSSGDLVPYDRDGGERAEACIDADGLLLEELWWLDGRPAERLVAVDVAVGEPALDADFAVDGDPVGELDDGAGSVHEVDVSSRLPDDRFHELRDVPARFAHRGRHAVVWPSSGRGDRVASLVDVWTDGADVVLFERGGALHRSEVLAPPPWATRLDVAGGGEAWLVLGLRGNELRLFPDDGEFVRIVATLPPDELRRLAQAIVEVPGGPIVEVDPARARGA